MHPILISHHSLTSASSYTPRILSSLRAQLPLRNLHSKAASGTARTTVRSIQELDVDFIPWGQKEFDDPKTIKHGSLLGSPLVNVCFVECDDSDVYKTSLRHSLQSWRRACPPSSPCLIVLVNPHAGTGDEKKTGVFSNLKAQTGTGGMLGRLKNDFEGGGNKDRCIQLNISSRSQHPPKSNGPSPTTLPPSDTQIYIEFLNTLKDLILISFDSLVKDREESVKRGEAARLLPGWNWGSWFLEKETLAYSYEGMHLLEDALIVYDELEASLEMVMRDGNAWVGRSGIEELIVDVQPLLDSPDTPFVNAEKRESSSANGTSSLSRPSSTSLPSSRTPYHELISSSQFSIFDYRTYIFRRQVAMLGKLRQAAVLGGREAEKKHRVEEVARRGLAFVLSLGRWLQENALHANDAQFLVESWLFDAALSIISRCDGWAGQVVGEDPEMKPFVQLRSQILQVMVSQLDRVGVKSGFLPSTYPFLLTQELLPQKNSVLFEPGPDGFSPASPAQTTSFASQQTSYPSRLAKAEMSKPPDGKRRRLVQAAHDEKEFYALYQSSLRKSRHAEEVAKRSKQALSIDERQAALFHYRKDYDASRKVYLFMCDQLRAAEGESWTSLRLRVLGRALECGIQLQSPLDLSLGLEYLNAFAVLYGESDTVAREAITDSQKALCKSITSRWGTVDADPKLAAAATLQHPIFDVNLHAKATEPLEIEDGCRVKVRVWNGSPNLIHVDDVRLCFSGKELQQLWFISGPAELRPEWNVVDAVCYTPVSGLFRLENSRVMMPNLTFDYDPRASRAAESSTSKGVFLRIPEDPYAFNAKMRIPDSISLDLDARLEVIISAGRQDIPDAVLNLSEADEAIKFDISMASSVDSQYCKIEHTDSGMRLTGLKKGSSIILSVPYVSVSRVDALAIRVSVDYHAAGRPQLRRAFRRTQAMDLSLPVAVNVQDYFRPDCLISRFTIASATGGALRVHSADLSTQMPNSAFDCEPCRKRQEDLAATSQQPLSFLFKITKRSPAGRAVSTDVLRLVLKYRMVHDEIESVLDKLIDDTCSSADIRHCDTVRQLINKLVLCTSPDQWTGRYLSHGSIGPLDRITAVGLIPDDLVRGVMDINGMDASKLEDLKRDVVAAAVAVAPHNVALTWRTLEIPVEVPAMQIIASSRFELHDDPESYIVGKPISVTLSISSSFAWADPDEAAELRMRMRYEIVPEPGSWLVSGVRMGAYMAETEQPCTVTLKLIPLRHGELLLPTVVMQPTAPSAAPSSGSLSAGGLGVPPSCESYQEDAAVRVMVYPVQETMTFRIASGGYEGERIGTVMRVGEVV